jgi:hypothetical protein
VIQIGVSNPDQLSSVVLFYHLEDKAGGGSTPWNDGVAMQPQGGGQYSYDLVSKTIPAFNPSHEWRGIHAANLVTLSMCGKK